MARKSIELKDVGPIPLARFEVPEEGGVLLAVGRNGAGKSHLLGAVNKLVTGQGEISVRDGASEAVVQGFGVTVRVARKSSQSGECELFGLEGPDPSVLVDPHIKDRAAAHAERIRALCKLAHAEIDRAAFVRLAGGEEGFARLVKPSSLDKGDLPSVAAAVKRDFETAARAAEAEAQNLQIEAKGIASAADDVPESEPLDERALQQELESASAQLGELRGRQAQADELRKSAARARETLETFGDKGTAEAGKAAESALLIAKANTAAAEDHVHDMEVRVSEAREALHRAEAQAVAAKSRLRETQAAEKSAAEAIEQAFQDFTRRKQLAQAVKAADAAADVDPEQIAALEERQSTARQTLQRAEVVRRALEQRERARAKAEQAGEALSRALSLRESARGCEQILTAALARVCPPGMRIEGGFIVVDSDRGVENWDELSEGERWGRVIPIAAASVSKPGLLVCREGGWRSMQPSTQALVHNLLREHGLVMFVEVVDDGDLRVQPYQPDGQEAAA